MTALSEAFGVTDEQLSVAVAVPRAALIWAGVGLHPNAKVVPVAVITGAVLSLTVMVWVQVATLPRESVAL